MRNTVVFSGNTAGQELTLDGVPVRCGQFTTKQPDFDPEQSPDHVWLKVLAFSCNYRDKAIILNASRQQKESYFAIGSEFVAEVLAIGNNVTDIVIGDRVIANNSWPFTDIGKPGGIPTNHASKEFQAIRADQVIKVPDAMPDTVAAAFSLGAQTAYSMLHKLDLPEGASVLVTAAKSNTSLFIFQALKQLSVNIHALSTSERHADYLLDIGVDQLTVFNPQQPLFQQLQRGFDYVIDPFLDIYLPHVVQVMNPKAKYVTCGLLNQATPNAIHPQMGQMLLGVMGSVVYKNLQILGNCLGTTADLQRAIDDYAAGKLTITLDDVFGDDEVAPFLNRTYNAPDRLGKVVFEY